MKLDTAKPKALKSAESAIYNNLYKAIASRGVPSNEDAIVIEAAAKELAKAAIEHGVTKPGPKRARTYLSNEGLKRVGEVEKTLKSAFGEQLPLKAATVTGGVIIDPEGWSVRSTIDVPNLMLQTSQGVDAWNFGEGVRKAQGTLNLLGGRDTTPEIPVAEGVSAPTAARTEGSIEDSPVEDLIASAAGE